jgi:hypothetical protein
MEIAKVKKEGKGGRLKEARGERREGRERGWMRWDWD